MRSDFIGNKVVKMIMDTDNVDKKVSRLDTLGYYSVLVMIFLTLILVLPVVTQPFAKILVFSFLTLATLIIWSTGRLKAGVVSVPRSPMILALILLPLPYLISSIFSDVPRDSFVGQGFEIGTFVSTFILVVSALLVVAFVKTSERLTAIMKVFLGVFALVTVYQVIRLFTGPGFLDFGVLTTSSSNLIGKWYDLGIFFGLFALFSSLALDFKHAKPKAVNIAWVVFVASVVMLVLVHFKIVWFILALLSLVQIIYVYTFKISKPDSSEATKSHSKSTPIVSVTLLVVSIIMFIFGGAINDRLTSYFDIVQLEVRPNWASTLSIVGSTLKHDPILGVGPNRFSVAWLQNKPKDVNTSVFWNTDFSYGVGFLPSTLVTTGLLGALFWLLFLIAFIYSGQKAILAPVRDSKMRFYTVSSFLSSLFLWILMIVYVPGPAVFVVTFVMTGVFIGCLMRDKIIGTLAFQYGSDPKRNFVAILILILLMLSSVTFLYVLVENFMGSIALSKGLKSVQLEGNLEEGEKSFMRALRLNPHEDDYYRLVSNFYIAKMNDIVNSNDSRSQDELRADFQTALSDGLTAAQTAVSIDPTDYRNYTALGSVYESVMALNIEGAYESAKKAYEDAVIRNPQGPAVRLQLARLEAAKQNFGSAKKYADEALQLKPNYSDAVFLKSQIAVTEGNVPEAIISATKASELAPNEPLVFFQIGFLRYTNKEYNEAVNALERAILLNPQYANARYFLGLSYSKLGRVDDAIEQFVEISKNNPDNQEIQLILKNLRQGRPPLTGSETVLEEPETREELPVSDL